MVFKFHDDFLQLLGSGPVLKLNLQHNLNTFLVKTDIIIKLQAFENTWELDKLEAGGTVMQAGFLSAG